MAAFKHAKFMFKGGTAAIKALVGTRVRVRQRMESAALFDPIQNTQKTTAIKVGAIGFVANPHPEQLDMLLVAFPPDGSAAPATLAALSRSDKVSVIVVNGPTFKEWFDIESV
jgi:hypothetical protein